MEIPEKTWQHILSLMAEVENYTTYVAHIHKTEAVIDLLASVIADSQRTEGD